MSTRTSRRRGARKASAASGGPPKPSPQSGPHRSVSAAPRRRRRNLWIWGVTGGAGIGVVIALFVVFSGASSSSSGGSATGPTFATGAPGAGAQAPALALASTAGGTFDLSAQRGKTVLLYFQEGVGCQPCWDQMRDIQGQMSSFKALGIDEMVSISSDDDISILKQKASDEGITIPVLSDPGLTVSHTYDAPSYGMMMGSKDGHTFVVVGPDGRIKWRADYGGAPDYTMYVKPSDLLAQMRSGMSGR